MHSSDVSEEIIELSYEELKDDDTDNENMCYVYSSRGYKEIDFEYLPLEDD